MAVAAMLLPIGLGICATRCQPAEQLRPDDHDRSRSARLSAGSHAAGTAANLVAIAQLKQLAHFDVSFARWMLYGLPACILMVPVA